MKPLHGFMFIFRKVYKFGFVLFFRLNFFLSESLYYTLESRKFSFVFLSYFYALTFIFRIPLVLCTMLVRERWRPPHLPWWNRKAPRSTCRWWVAANSAIRSPMCHRYGPRHSFRNLLTMDKYWGNYFLFKHEYFTFTIL